MQPEVFRGKRVLVIGAGESGSDICNEIADEAAKVAIVKELLGSYAEGVAASMRARPWPGGVWPPRLL